MISWKDYGKSENKVFKHSNLELLVVRNFLKTWSLKSNYERGNGKIGREEISWRRAEFSDQWQKTSSLLKSTPIFHQPIFFYFLWKEQHGCQSVLSINLSIDTPVCLSTAMVQWNYVEKHCGEAFNNWRHQYRTQIQSWTSDHSHSK